MRLRCGDAQALGETAIHGVNLCFSRRSNFNERPGSAMVRLHSTIRKYEADSVFVYGCSTPEIIQNWCRRKRFKRSLFANLVDKGMFWRVRDSTRRKRWTTYSRNGFINKIGCVRVHESSTLDSVGLSIYPNVRFSYVSIVVMIHFARSTRFKRI